MIKIKDMKCGDDNVEFTAMISHVTLGKTNGAHKSNYLSIVFQDDTGTIDAKLWNASQEHIESLKTGAVVRAKGDIIKYSDGLKNDLSQLKVKDFFEEMKKVASESYRVLKKDKFCAILMGDTRQKGCMIPMSFDVMKIFQDAGFKLKELIIKEQHNCKATGYWKTNSVKYNFLLIAHEYLFVFRK